MEYKASTSEFQNLASSHKKAQDELEKHRAMLRKLEDFRDETSEDLKERPDASKFAGIIEGIKLSIRDADDRMTKMQEETKYTLADHTHSIDQMKARMSNIFKELDRRLTRDDEVRIMHHVKKLPQYKDFEELYAKTIPVCARFEKRVFGMQIEVDKLGAIVQ